MKNKTLPDPLFEELIASVPARVAEAARLRYYGFAYEAIFGPVPRPPLPRGANPREMRPWHTDAEDAVAGNLVRNFNEKHPGRMLELLRLFKRTQAKEPVVSKNELPDDNWELLLPNDLQATVDNAPKTQSELDKYFRHAVDKT
ncbi:MAG: hypothetical protein WC766_03275 [Patescibacteria group bacterium]|jgi:hypothetical protein